MRTWVKVTPSSHWVGNGLLESQLPARPPHRGGSIQVLVNYSDQEVAAPGAWGAKMLWTGTGGMAGWAMLWHQTDLGLPLALPLTSLTVVLASWCLSFPSCKVGLTLTAVPTSRAFVMIK